jgi:UPF0716 protein FxsA
MRSPMRWIPVAVMLTGLVEVAAFLLVAHLVGVGWALLAAVLLTGVGIILLRREGGRAWRRFRLAAEAGRPPGAEVTDGVVGLLGALLLAVPGFVTAAAGLLLLVPPVRAVARGRVESLAGRRLSADAMGSVFGPRRVTVYRGDPVDEPPQPPPTPGPAIEGEIVTPPRP